MQLAQRFGDMGRSAALLSLWALVAGAGAIVLNMDDALDGEAHAYVRLALGVLGIGASAMLWSGRNFGRDGLRAILVWSLLQIPYYAELPDGNVTEQLFDAFLGATSETRVNGELTSYSKVGLNLMGVGLSIWANSCRDRIDLWRRRGMARAGA